MKTVSVSSLPALFFAHVFDAPKYKTQFPVLPRQIEVTYIYKGSILSADAESEVLIEEGDLHVNLFDVPRAVHADGYHCHHTVSACLDLCIGENLPNGLFLPVRTPAKLLPPEIYRLIDETITRNNMGQLDSLRTRTAFLDLLCLIDAANRKAASPLPRGVYLAGKAKKYISEHIREPITQREVAASLAVTPGYLCDLFREAQGEPLMRYINRIKLGNVRALMENEAVTLREAAAAFGYADPNYVSRLYKQLFGHNITFRV